MMVIFGPVKREGRSTHTLKIIRLNEELQCSTSNHGALVRSTTTLVRRKQILHEGLYLRLCAERL